MTRGTLSILFSLADTRQIFVIVALAVLGALTEAIGFVLLVPLLALLVATDDSGGSLLSPVTDWLNAAGFTPSLGTLLICFFGLVLLRAIADYARTVISLRLSIGLVDSLRERAFNALLAADWRALSRMRQSENRALLISEIDRTAVAVDQLAALTRTVIGLGAIGLAALAISPWVAVAGAAVGLLVLALYGSLRKRARSLGEAMGEQYREVYGALEENLDAVRVIKSFGAEQAASERVLSGFKALRSVRVRFAADTARARGVLQVGAAAVACLLIWQALTHWDISPIVLLPLVALFARALPQFSSLLNLWQVWSHSSPAIQSTHRLIAEAESAAETTTRETTSTAAPQRCISLNDVSLSHREGVATLSGVSLSLQMGETVALVGPSGAGKSTLADILGGLLAPDSGEVLLDGNPLDPAMRRTWRRQVAYVDQSPVLFHGSVRDNLSWADPDASEERLHQVLGMAAADFVHELPNGLDCALGEKGRQLSGGERQRIVLARALLRDPALLILDEATSALDSVSDAAVAQAIADLKGQRTILIIGHRGALTESAERTIAIENGRIVGG